MRKTLSIIFLVLIVSACKNESKTKIAEAPEEVKFDQELADELASMAEVDQVAANIPQGKY